jgi:multisubunit Na+/H+ antiporter MnhE subunit
MHKLTAAVVLPVRFAWAVVISGVHTIDVIVRRGLSIGAPSEAAFVRIGFAPMSPRGAALLGCLISLTPGSTIIDFDLERRELIVHMLDMRQAAGTVDSIRRRFEPPLRAWFGEPA